MQTSARTPSLMSSKVIFHARLLASGSPIFVERLHFIYIFEATTYLFYDMWNIFSAVILTLTLTSQNSFKFLEIFWGRHTNRQTNRLLRKHNLLGGGNNGLTIFRRYIYHIFFEDKLTRTPLKRDILWQAPYSGVVTRWKLDCRARRELMCEPRHMRKSSL